MFANSASSTCCYTLRKDLPTSNMDHSIDLVRPFIPCTNSWQHRAHCPRPKANHKFLICVLSNPHHRCIRTRHSIASKHSYWTSAMTQSSDTICPVWHFECSHMDQTTHIVLLINSRFPHDRVTSLTIQQSHSWSGIRFQPIRIPRDQQCIKHMYSICCHILINIEQRTAATNIQLQSLNCTSPRIDHTVRSASLNVDISDSPTQLFTTLRSFEPKTNHGFRTWSMFSQQRLEHLLLYTP